MNDSRFKKIKLAKKDTIKVQNLKALARGTGGASSGFNDENIQVKNKESIIARGPKKHSTNSKENDKIAVVSLDSLNTIQVKSKKPTI
jgi:hypothetical protein